MFGAIRAIAARLGVAAPEPPRMANGFAGAGVAGGTRTILAASVDAQLPDARILSSARVFESARSVVHSITIRNRGTEDIYVCAFDRYGQRPPKDGERTSDRTGDRHVVKVAADSAESMIFPGGWRIRRGLQIVPSWTEETISMSRLVGADRETVPGIYWSVEYDHDDAPAGTSHGLSGLG